jgi:hypothetical protein
MSNSDTLAPARKTATARPSKSAPAAVSDTCTWREASITARDAIAALAFESQLIDDSERDDSSGMAKRLMSMVVSDLGETAADARKGEFESAFFNAEALINGALGLSADKVGPKVEANLRRALVIIDKMTDHLCGGFEVRHVFDAIRAAPATGKQLPDPLRGYTPAQAKCVFEEIAMHANTMLRLTQQDFGDEAQLQVEAAGVGFQMIGALADQMCGEMAVGKPANWAGGEAFYRAGQAVQA